MDRDLEEKVEENVEEKVEENVEEKVEEKTEKEEIINNDEKPKNNKSFKIVLIVLLILIVLLCAYFFLFKNKKNEKVKRTDVKEVKSEYYMNGNSLQNFDLAFMKLENNGKNQVYSPLSIKYALEMLAEGAKGETKEQLDSVIGDYKANKYVNNSNMSFANAMFIRDSFKSSVNSNYTDLLKEKYNAELIYDSFSNPDNINKWVSNKTFNLIEKLVDEMSEEAKFYLINALAINMDWNNQIHCAVGHKVPCLNEYGIYSVNYAHEKLDEKEERSYSVTSYGYQSEEEFEVEFDDSKKVKGAEVLADFNRYDIIKELGEDNIRKTVGDDYKKWLATEDGKDAVEDGYGEKDVNKFLDNYIKEIKENYGKGESSTDFLIYEDENTKSFAKDLKEYNNTTLQYIGIMPKKQELSKYIDTLTVDDANKIINGLKEVKIESFKEGVATVVRGTIPFFNFDYELKLQDDLEKLGIKNVFSSSKADLSNLSDIKGIHIDQAIHKANIEFSNDGIRAAAATSLAGAGATGGGYDYLFKIPVEKIDISFDKPYLFLIRDKKSGEVWFAGAVYEPTKID